MPTSPGAEAPDLLGVVPPGMEPHPMSQTGLGTVSLLHPGRAPTLQGGTGERELQSSGHTCQGRLQETKMPGATSTQCRPGGGTGACPQRGACPAPSGRVGTARGSPATGSRGVAFLGKSSSCRSAPLAASTCFKRLGLEGYLLARTHRLTEEACARPSRSPPEVLLLEHAG